MITAVFGTMALKHIEALQCSVTYSMKQTSSFIDCCSVFIDLIVCDCSFTCRAFAVCGKGMPTLAVKNLEICPNTCDFCVHSYEFAQMYWKFGRMYQTIAQKCPSLVICIVKEKN